VKGTAANLTGLLVSGTAVLLLDQWSKRIVQLLSPGCHASGIPFLQIRRVVNLNHIYRSRHTHAVLILIWLFALASAVLLHRSGLWFQSRISEIGLGLAFGGAAGNLLDIIRYRSVVDFIDLRWWPVFNVADIGIVSGLLLGFWH